MENTNREKFSIVARVTRKREIPPYGKVKEELDIATKKTKRALGTTVKKTKVNG